MLSARSSAADASTITIPEMDCSSCAKKIVSKLAEVPGVAKVESDVKARTIKVTHKADGAAPSPKALWEAVEQAELDPSKLEDSSKVYTKKPTS